MAGGDGAGGLISTAVRELTGAVSAEQVLSQLAALVVPDLGTWCLADLLQYPDLVVRVAAVGPDGDLAMGPMMGGPQARRSSAQAQGLLARLLDSPQAVMRLGVDQMTELMTSTEPRVRAQAELAMQLGSTDVLVLGLMSRSKPMGVLTIGRAGGAFSDDDLARLRELALLAGALLDNARLVRAQRNMAAALQTRLLPPLPTVPGLALAARYAPADLGLEVGGDWYDVFAPRPGVVALVIGDTTGHDVDAAARMAELRSLLRAVAVGPAHGAPRSPAALLTELDRTASVLGAEASATCLYAEVHEVGAELELRWSSAGHLPAILLRDGSATVLEAEADLMLGVDPTTSRADHGLPLRRGDRLVLFTDGLIETRASSLDERLALLLEQVRSTAEGNLEEVADLLVSSLAGGADDVALLLVEVS